MVSNMASEAGIITDSRLMVLTRNTENTPNQLILAASLLVYLELYLMGSHPNQKLYGHGPL